MKKHLLLFLVIVFALLSGGCAAPRQTEPTPAASEPLVITDARERQVTLDSPPRRVVIIGKGLFMIADAAYIFPEAAQRIIAMGNAGQGTSNFIALIDPDYESKATLSGDAGAEQIAALYPDVVILKSFLAEKVGQPIEDLGIPVVYVDFETPEQYARDLAILGQVFDDPQRAAEAAAYYQQAAAEIEQAVQGADRPRTLLIAYSDKDGNAAFQVPPADWMQTRMVAMAGGTPVWTEAALGGGWTQVSLEQIAAWDPDQIFVIAYRSDPGQVAAGLQADPNWAALRAVRDGNLRAFPGDLYSWDQPDPRWILGLTWLAARLYPDAFPDMDILTETQNFYQTLYGLDAAFFEAHIRPTLHGDLP